MAGNAVRRPGSTLWGVSDFAEIYAEIKQLRTGEALTLENMDAFARKMRRMAKYTMAAAYGAMIAFVVIEQDVLFQPIDSEIRPLADAFLGLIGLN